MSKLVIYSLLFSLICCVLCLYISLHTIESRLRRSIGDFKVLAEFHHSQMMNKHQFETWSEYKDAIKELRDTNKGLGIGAYYGFCENCTERTDVPELPAVTEKPY